MDTIKVKSDISFRTAISERHIGLLKTDEQHRIQQTSLLIAGCGVGSVVAVSAVRMGFEKLRIIDGDVVEVGNLNRQAYSVSDIGKSKAKALAAILIGINPDCQIDIIPYYVDTRNAVKLVADMDIIVDAIDPTSSLAVFALHQAAREQGCPIISPLDIGWGGALQVFLPENPSLSEITGINESNIESKNNEQLFEALLDPIMALIPDYLQPVITSYLDGSLTYYPQPVTGALISAALTVTAAMRLALGQPLNTDSNQLLFDPWLTHEVTVTT